jgi:hypothetical protein
LHSARAAQKKIPHRKQKNFSGPLKPNGSFPIFLLPPQGGPGA